MNKYKYTYRNNIPDLKAKITLFHTNRGGRKRHSCSGYSPHHVFGNHETVTSGMHDYLDVQELHPGKSTITLISLIQPEYFNETVRINDPVYFYEGARLVGMGIVLEIYNSILCADPKEVSEVNVDEITKYD